MSDECVVVLSTLPSDQEAASIARALIDDRLAACVNILPAMTSVYRWTDGVQQGTEHQLVIKTTRSRVAALWEKLEALHPYDLPEFVVLPIVDGSELYLKWIRDATSVSPAPA